MGNPFHDVDTEIRITGYIDRQIDTLLQVNAVFVRDLHEAKRREAGLIVCILYVAVIAVIGLFT